MMLDEFSEPMNALAAAFDKNVKPEMGRQYYQAFQSLTSHQWVTICTIAKQSLERFPSIAALRGIAFEHNLFERKQKFELPQVSFECKCGGTFALLESDLYRMTAPIKCANPNCNRTFEPGFILKNMRGLFYSLHADWDKYFGRIA